MSSDDDEDLDAALRRLRRETEDFDAEVASSEAELERSQVGMTDVLRVLAAQGQVVRLAVGTAAWSGVVVHAGNELVTVRTAGGAEVDVAIDAVTSIRAGSAADRGLVDHRRGAESMVARLRELAMGEEVVDVGGPGLATLVTGSVRAVARDHVEVVGRDGGVWLLPLRQVGFVIRHPRLR